MSRRDRRGTSSRDDIVDAAQRIAAASGAAHVTLDAVARESGLSKGGVLYNFPNKDALLTGMLDRLVARFAALVERYREEFADGPNPTLRAVLKASRFKDEIDPKVPMAILAAAAEKPELLAPVRESVARFSARVREETTDPDLAMLLWAAADGLMFQGLLDVAPCPPGGKDAYKDVLLDRLLVLAGEMVPGRDRP